MQKNIFLLALIIAFTNGSVITPIVGGIGQEINEVEKVYISTKFEDGPLSIEVQLAHPRLTYIGVINGKNFYYDDQPVSWPNARSYCGGLAMILADFTNKAEQDFVFGRLPSLQFWTSAILRISSVYGAFSWDSTGASLPSPSLPWFYFEYARPVMSFNAEGSGTSSNALVMRDQDELLRPLCYIR